MPSRADGSSQAPEGDCHSELSFAEDCDLTIDKAEAWDTAETISANAHRAFDR